ncbi:MAG: hypothetical protein ACI9R3_005244 [Verrucomicrobiales bacterium]|jgi:hypothetical protein
MRLRNAPTAVVHTSKCCQRVQVRHCAMINQTHSAHRILFVRRTFVDENQMNLLLTEKKVRDLLN